MLLGLSLACKVSGRSSCTWPPTSFRLGKFCSLTGTCDSSEAPTGLDVVVQLAGRAGRTETGNPAAGSALLADDEHHQNHKYKVCCIHEWLPRPLEWSSAVFV
jgi:hypothetical protein